MSSSVAYACGCQFHLPRGVGGPVSVLPCSRHRQLGLVSAALGAVERAQEQLAVALKKAHEELPPMQIEQEERQASGDDRWR